MRTHSNDIALRVATLVGRQARVSGLDLTHNPYLPPGPRRDSALADQWEAGWLGADLELAQGASKEDVLSLRFVPRSSTRL